MKFHGAITALVTPFKNGKIDEKAFRAIIEHQIRSGIDGLVPCGTTGESPTLTHEEHKRVIRIVVETSNGRVPVIAGTGSNSTAEAVELTRYAKKAGADGALLVTPYYNKPTQQGLYLHFQTIAKSVDIPVILYNIPGRSVVNISPETIARLAKISNIVGVKEATGSMDQASHIRSLCNLTILSGDDSLTLPLMSIGAKGVISVIANLLPEALSEMVDSYFAGDHKKAMEVHYKLFPLCRAMFIETNPIPVKRAMKLAGRCSDEVRLPLSPIQPGNEKLLVQALKAYGVKLKGNA